MKEGDGFAMKNKRGCILIWTAAYLKREVIEKLGGKKEYERWKRMGCKAIQVRLTEVSKIGR